MIPPKREVRLFNFPWDSYVKKPPVLRTFLEKIRAFSFQKTLKMFTAATFSGNSKFYLTTGSLDQFCIQNIQSAASEGTLGKVKFP